MRAAAATVVVGAVVVLLAALTTDPGRVELEAKARPTARSIELTAKTALDQLEGKRPALKATAHKAAAPVQSAAESIGASVKAALSELAGTPKKTKMKLPATRAPPANKVQAAGKAAVGGASAVSATEVHKIMKSMVKAAAAKKAAKVAKESKTERMQDRILAAKNRLASMKLKKSKDFAAYEKSDEEVDDAKSRALQTHDEYQEDVERERADKKRLAHLQQKLANHLTGQHARSDLNSYYAHLNEEAIKSIPQKIRDADKRSSVQAARYKRTMEHHKVLGQRGRDVQRGSDHKMDTKRTVSLKQFPQVNVWDADPHKQDVIDSAEKKLKQNSRAADKEILKTEARKR
jgi:hypothetical protein